MATYKVEQTCPQCKCVRLIEEHNSRKAGFTGLCFKCSRPQKLTPPTICPKCKATIDKPGLTGLCRACWCGSKGGPKVEQVCPQCKESRIIERQATTKPHFTGLCFKCSRGLHFRTHMETDTRPHRIWKAMKNRCYNRAGQDYPYYGGRGITVCERWLKSYEHFREDMGYPPEGMSLDRIDTNGPYSPENCRWATHTEADEQYPAQRPDDVCGQDAEHHSVGERDWMSSANSHLPAISRMDGRANSDNSCQEKRQDRETVRT